MNFKIYQAQKGNFFADIIPASEYILVAEVEANSLDEAYSKSQNISKSWLKNNGVKSEYTNCRSTSVGDIIYSEEEKKGYLVDMVGFKNVDIFL